jgi:hypothetical protein
MKTKKVRPEVRVVIIVATLVTAVIISYTFVDIVRYLSTFGTHYIP